LFCFCYVMCVLCCVCCMLCVVCVLLCVVFGGCVLCFCGVMCVLEFRLVGLDLVDALLWRSLFGLFRRDVRSP